MLLKQTPLGILWDRGFFSPLIASATLDTLRAMP